MGRKSGNQALGWVVWYGENVTRLFRTALTVQQVMNTGQRFSQVLNDSAVN